jgi:fatty-acyl-CoA synthase
VASQYIAQTPATYGFPLLIKGLLESGVTRAPEQEIVSANQNRLTYWQFAERVGWLASGLADLGVSEAIRWQSWIGRPIGIWSVSSRCQ